jgi:uncharacterized protein (DUF983 family)
MSGEDRPAPSSLATALRCRCPRCGQGRLYDGLLQVTETCPVCGLDLREHDAGDGPAFFAMCAVMLIVVPAALIVESLFSPPLWVHALLWGIVMIGLTFVLLRVIKAWLIAQQYKHRSTDEAGGGVS